MESRLGAGLRLLPPSTLMGATLPALCQELALENGLERELGRLNAVNTAGAVLGVLFGSYLLLPTVGLSATLWVAAATSLTAAGLAWTPPRVYLLRAPPRPSRPEAAAPRGGAPAPPMTRPAPPRHAA